MQIQQITLFNAKKIIIVLNEKDEKYVIMLILNTLTQTSKIKQTVKWLSEAGLYISVLGTRPIRLDENIMINWWMGRKDHFPV